MKSLVILALCLAIFTQAVHGQNSTATADDSAAGAEGSSNNTTDTAGASAQESTGGNGTVTSEETDTTNADGGSSSNTTDTETPASSTDTTSSNTTDTETSESSSDTSNNNATDTETPASSTDTNSNNTTDTETQESSSNNNATDTNPAATAANNATSTANETTNGDSDSALDDGVNNATSSAKNASSEATPEGTNGTSSSNATSDGDAGGESGDAEPAGTPHTNASDVDMKLFGVSEPCAHVVQKCFLENANEKFRKFMYCDAYSTSRTCIAENRTGSNSSVKSCTDMERQRLEVFACGPSNMRMKVSHTCKARLTQCTASLLTASDMTGKPDLELFKAKTCDVLEEKDCLDRGKHNAVCSKAEIEEISESAPCSAVGLISSALLVAMALVVNKLL